jgi:hypothetical protein
MFITAHLDSFALGYTHDGKLYGSFLVGKIHNIFLKDYDVSYLTNVTNAVALQLLKSSHHNSVASTRTLSAKPVNIVNYSKTYP